MARGSSRGPGSSPRRPASSRPSSRAGGLRSPLAQRASRDTGTGTGKGKGASKGTDKVAQPSASSWRTRLGAARANQRTVRRVGFSIVALFLVILITPTLRAYLQQRSDISALRDKVSQQKVRVEELQKEQARWEDRAYVEQQARTRLKFVKVGEKSYTVLDPRAAKGEPAPAPVPENPDPWYDSIWASMRAADVPSNPRR